MVTALLTLSLSLLPRSPAPLTIKYQYIISIPFLFSSPGPQNQTKLSLSIFHSNSITTTKTMDMYGSLSNPPDNFLDFPLTATDSHLHLPPPQHHFSDDPNFPSVPVRPSSFQFPQSDEAAELEWLSQFIDDDTTSFHDFPPSHTVLPIGSHTTTSSFLSNTYADHDHIHNNNNNSNIHINNNNNIDNSKSRSRREANGQSPAGEGGVRRCSHCASEKTPQWRTGPLGPKTLCNACGVRFKSGRLVPEYRPAASPTFVLSQHSNSHRKVMELRRQKELIRQQQQQQQQQHSKGEEEQCYRHKHDFRVC